MKSEFIIALTQLAAERNLPKEIVLSAIFKWFQSDFINDLRRRGLPTERGLVDYVASVAPISLRDELDGADDFSVVFSDYDWAVNKQE